MKTRPTHRAPATRVDTTRLADSFRTYRITRTYLIAAAVIILLILTM